MPHPRLALHSLSTASWPLERDLDLYATLGVARVGFLLDKLEAASPDRAVELVRSAGVRATQLVAKGMTLTEPARWPDERARLIAGLDLAAALGGTGLSVTCGAAGGLGWDAAAAALAEAIGPVRDAAARLGLVVAIEQTLAIRPEIGFVHSFGDSVVLGRELGLAVVAEAHYCWGERLLAEHLRDAGELLAMVQLSDLIPPASEVPDRAVPGDGVLPLERVVRLAVDAGYRGCFELEQLGPRIEAEGYESSARRGVAALDALLTRVLGTDGLA